MTTRMAIARLDEETHFRANRIFCVVGKRNTGKSVVIRNIIFHLSSQIDFAVLVSPTESTRQECGVFMPRTWIHSSYNPDMIQGLVDVQKRSTMMGRARKVLLILDDLLYDNRLFKSEAIREIFLNGRHLSITLVISAQYAVAIPPMYRSNTDIVILLRDTARQNRKKLYDSFCGIFDNLDIFNAVFSDLTANYGCMVINNCSKSNDIEDTADPPVMWYRATLELPQFSVGSRDFWQLHRKFMRIESSAPAQPPRKRVPRRSVAGAMRLDTDSQCGAYDGRGGGGGGGGGPLKGRKRARDDDEESSVVKWSFK